MLLASLTENEIGFEDVDNVVHMYTKGVPTQCNWKKTFGLTGYISCMKDTYNTNNVYMHVVSIHQLNDIHLYIIANTGINEIKSK